MKWERSEKALSAFSLSALVLIGGREGNAIFGTVVLVERSGSV
jgi:hypothetical protein